MKSARTAVIIGLTLLPLMTWGQQQGAIELTTVAEVEVVQKNEKGEEVRNRIEASKANVAPGDTVIFTVHYVNNGDAPAADVVIKNPVPQHMTYVDKSAEGAGTKVDFSIDGGKTHAAPDKLTITGADGKVRTASASEYTHIRWALVKPVGKGGKGIVSFRAKVK